MSTLEPSSPAMVDASLDLSTHAHRWRIDEQHGISSAGRCACGAERRFDNGWKIDAGLRVGEGSWLSRRAVKR